MSNPLTPPEVLTILRLRQWAYDRQALKSGAITSYKRQGWQQRQAQAHDARIIRVIDFERALAKLSEQEQALLITAYAHHEARGRIARLTACSERAVAYKLPTARRRLTAILDRLDLL